MAPNDWIEFVYRKYFHLFLYIGMRNYGLDLETAKGKIQETFVKVWENRNVIKNDTEPGIRGYAVRTLRNICINHLRRKSPFVDNQIAGGDEDEETGSIIENATDETANPLFEILLIEEKRLQEEAIRRLPEKYREPVRLSLMGVKPREISKKTGLRLSTFTNYKHRGLKQYEKIINHLDPFRKS